MNKVVASAAEAVADIRSGSTLTVGGFGLCGIPTVLIDASAGAGCRRAGGRLEQLRCRRLGPGPTTGREKDTADGLLLRR